MRTVYQLEIKKDGVVKVCHSYSPDITPETLYWASPDDDRMSVPYGFRSYKHAEWMFWAWKSLTGQLGWLFNIKEVQI